jgi:hypothetical protein
MREFLRSDKFAGLTTGTLGVAMAAFGGFGLVIVAFQRWIMSLNRTPRKPSPGFEHFDEMMYSIQGAFITYLPFMIALGVVFAAAGFYVCKGSRLARRIGQINAVLGIVWIAAYSYASLRLMQTIDMPIYQDPIFKWAMFAINVIFLLAFPALILYILQKNPEPTPPS